MIYNYYFNVWDIWRNDLMSVKTCCNIKKACRINKGCHKFATLFTRQFTRLGTQKYSEKTREKNRTNYTIYHRVTLRILNGTFLYFWCAACLLSIDHHQWSLIMRNYSFSLGGRVNRRASWPPDCKQDTCPQYHSAKPSFSLTQRFRISGIGIATH